MTELHCCNAIRNFSCFPIALPCPVFEFSVTAMLDDTVLSGTESGHTNKYHLDSLCSTIQDYSKLCMNCPSLLIWPRGHQRWDFLKSEISQKIWVFLTKLCHQINVFSNSNSSSSFFSNLRFFSNVRATNIFSASPEE